MLLVLALSGCTSFPEYVRNGFKVGPNYAPAPAPVAKTWIDANDKRVRLDTEDLSEWWNVFKIPDPNDPASTPAAQVVMGALPQLREKDKVADPILHELITDAVRENLTLRQAGTRILQARATLGVAVGNFFPQSQFLDGSATRNANSLETVNSQNLRQRYFSQWNYGASVAWELDFWGRFRRAIESADANLEASVFDYDDVLVTLLADVATNYVIMRTNEERIRYARENVTLQRKTVTRIEQRAKVGVDNYLNLDQAKSILYQTEATIPELEINLRIATNRLCVLLGIPMENLQAKLRAAPIPVTPVDVAAGIPADLLRRRPDVRRAERQAAAQSALIGVAEADFYPAISLNGNLGWSSEHFRNLFRPEAFNGTFGPSFQWNVLEYGRIINSVRFQDARFQEAVLGYQNTVLTAQQDVENGLITFLKAQERVKAQSQSVDFAEKAEKIVLDKYEAGTVDIAQLILLQQNLVQQQDTLAISKGEIAQGLLQVYKALGGGWEIGNHPSPRRPHLLRHHESTVVPQDAPPVARFGPPS